MAHISFKKPDLATFGKPIPRSIRITVIVILMLGIVISSFVLFDAERSESMTTLVDTPVFEYEHEASLTYQVHLNSNTVYESSTPKPGQMYFTKLVDYIDILPSYEFTCNSPAQVSGGYSATIFLEANNIPAQTFPVLFDKSEPEMNFEHTAALDYQVILKPNNLYSTTIIGPGETYFSSIVDHVEINADYTFSSDESSLSSGQFEVIGVLSAPSYWQKPYIIISSTPFEASEANTTIGQQFSISPGEYQQLAKEINKELGLHPRDMNLTIRFNVQLDAKTNKGSISESLAPSMTIPLSVTQFTVEGDLSQASVGNVPSSDTGTLRNQFSTNGTVAVFNDRFRIDLAPYQDLLETITEQTGVPPQEPRLVVVLDVNTTAESDKGIITENLAPSMTIPLSTKTIEISGELSDARSGSIDKKNIEIQSTPTSNNAGPIASVTAFSILFIVFVGMTRNKPDMAASFSEIVASINKKYRDYLVEVSLLPEHSEKLMIPVRSLEDVEKIAEELGKPIVHQGPSSPEEAHVYCVLDGSIRYQYSLNKESVE